MDLLIALGELALASRLRRLSDRLSRSAADIYREMGLAFDPRWFTVFFALSRRGSQSPSELAQQLGVSHSAVIQVAAQLARAGLVVDRPDPKDERRRLIRLSPRGRRLLTALEPVWEAIRRANAELIDEADGRLLADIVAVERAIDSRSMAERVRARLGLPPGGGVEIVGYRPAYKKHFRALNEAWLREHFEVEPEDAAILDDPNRRILNKGGEILFAVAGERVVGTCALIRHADGLLELGKMAVADAYRRRGIGRDLLHAALGRAAARGAAFLHLRTSPKLAAACRLYRREGFRTIERSPLPPQPYRRCSITMRRSLAGIQPRAKGGRRS